jgi:hypothetical protein
VDEIATILIAPSNDAKLPVVAFFVTAFVLFGWLASYSFGQPITSNLPNADIWQHVAALGALIDAPLSPSNPFVPTNESSRLFGPYWWIIAAVARATGLTPFEAYALGSITNLALLTAGIWSFARAYHRHPAAPFMLLAAMMIGWFAPPVYTGYYNPTSLMTGSAYPATTAIAAMLLHWATTIRLLERPDRARRIANGLIMAFVFVTHPFSAAVSLAGMLCFVVAWPDACRRGRIAVIVASGAGLALAAAWPFFNPYAVLSTGGSPRWFGIDFYTPAWLAGSLLPAITGVIGLLSPRRSRAGLPLLLLLAPIAIGFAAGATQAFAAGHRLLPLLTLLSQIGLADLLLRAVDARRPLLIAAPAALCLVGQAYTTHQFLEQKRRQLRTDDLVAAAAPILGDLQPGARIAGYAAAGFPFTALGHRVFATPFPEPLIRDLGARQRLNDRLFDPRLPRSERIALAHRLGIDVLVVHVPTTAPGVIAGLQRHARLVRRSGPLAAYRLEP